MKVKTVIGVHSVNEMIRDGWDLYNVNTSKSKPEFIMVKDDSKQPQQEIRPSRRDDVTN